MSEGVPKEELNPLLAKEQNTGARMALGSPNVGVNYLNFKTNSTGEGSFKSGSNLGKNDYDETSSNNWLLLNELDW